MARDTKWTTPEFGSEDELQSYVDQYSLPAFILMACLLQLNNPAEAAAFEHRCRDLIEAMQRLDFLDDLAEDAAHRHVGIPLTDLERHGLSVENLASLTDEVRSGYPRRTAPHALPAGGTALGVRRSRQGERRTPTPGAPRLRRREVLAQTPLFRRQRARAGFRGPTGAYGGAIALDRTGHPNLSTSHIWARTDMRYTNSHASNARPRHPFRRVELSTSMKCARPACGYAQDSPGVPCPRLSRPRR